MVIMILTEQRWIHKWACLLPRGLMRIQVGEDTGELRDARRPRDRSYELAKDRDAVLYERRGRDVAVADRGDGHHRPVERDDVPATWTAATPRGRVAR